MSRITVILLVATFGLGLIAGCESAPKTQLDLSTPENALDTYCRVMKNEDAEGMFKIQSLANRKLYGVESMKQGIEVFGEKGLDLRLFDHVQIESVEKTGREATVYFSFEGIEDSEMHYTLVEEDGEWKLDR